LNRDTVKAHYVDPEGNVHDIDITVETHDGKEYVCFITNHFSVYALSGDTTDQNTQIIVEEDDTVIADQNKEPVPQEEKPVPQEEKPVSQEESKDEAETPDTGDHNDLATWIIIYSTTWSINISDRDALYKVMSTFGIIGILGTSIILYFMKNTNKLNVIKICQKLLINFLKCDIICAYVKPYLVLNQVSLKPKVQKEVKYEQVRTYVHFSKHFI
jgi:hypothetical protein